MERSHVPVAEILIRQPQFLGAIRLYSVLSCETAGRALPFPPSAARFRPSTGDSPVTYNSRMDVIENHDAFRSEECAELLKALSEPLRLRMVDALRHGPLTVSDIADRLEVEMVTASHHLGILKQAHLVEVERDGRFKVYRLRDDLLTRVRGGGAQFLNLGCCRLEIPKPNVQEN